MMYEAEAKTKQARDCSGSRSIQKAGSVGKWSVLLLCTSALLSGCLDSGGSSGSSSSSYEVSTTTGTGGSIDPSSETVASGETAEFTVTPDQGYEIGSVTGCDGSLSGSTYTTGAITSDCQVSATFDATPDPNTYEVTTNAGTGGSISPSSTHVTAGETATFSVNPADGNSIDSVTGCDGSLSGNTYTTGAITQSCEVSASFSMPLIEDRYAAIGNDGGIIRDVENNLEWMRCSLGQTWDGNECTDSAIYYTWINAKTQAQGTIYGDHSDWRVPTIEELQTLIYCSGGNPNDFPGSTCSPPYDDPAIVQDAFPDTLGTSFWSASPCAADSDEAWSVHFFHGNDFCYAKTGTNLVRLVRDAD